MNRNQALEKSISDLIAAHENLHFGQRVLTVAQRGSFFLTTLFTGLAAANSKTAYLSAWAVATGGFSLYSWHRLRQHRDTAAHSVQEAETQLTEARYGYLPPA